MQFKGYNRLRRFRIYLANKDLNMSNAERLKYFAGVINGMTGEVTSEMQQIQQIGRAHV